jgi:hypothetical protein
MKVMISISQILEMTMFALSFAPFTLCSYCTSAVCQVSVACTLTGWSVVGKCFLSMAHGPLLIPHCDIGPNTKRTTPLKGHGLAGARHFSLGHQKSHGNFKVKKIWDYTNSTLLILLRPLISFYLVAFDFYYGKEKSNLIFNHGPLKSDSSYKT